jgi:hypothetical protein
MGRYNQRQTTTETLAIGIKGNRSSLCGAIERFQRNGTQWNGLLSLKEQCARRIALMKNEQLKCFITAYLPATLFQYVTKDIFDLRRYEFTSNYADDLNLCEVCSLDPDEKGRMKCPCPRMKAAIDELNKYFFKRMNHENTAKTNKSKRFELIYKILNDEEDDWDEDDSISYFLYLFPCEYYNETDMYSMDDEAFEIYRVINDQVSVEEKLLFIDVMRFFGGFQTDQEQPRLILHRRREFPL